MSDDTGSRPFTEDEQAFIDASVEVLQAAAVVYGLQEKLDAAQAEYDAVSRRGIEIGQQIPNLPERLPVLIEASIQQSGLDEDAETVQESRMVIREIRELGHPLDPDADLAELEAVGRLADRIVFKVPLSWN